MAVKESSSTIYFQYQPLIQLETTTGNKTDTFVCSLNKHHILLGMAFLKANNGIIVCGNAIISFSEKTITLICKKANNTRISTMTNSDTPNFISGFPYMFISKNFTELLTLCQINYHSYLMKGKSASNTKLFTVPDKISLTACTLITRIL